MGIRSKRGNLFRARVSDFIRDGRRILDDRFRAWFPNLCFQIDHIAIYPVTDNLVWPHSMDGIVSCKVAYSMMFHDISAALSLVWCSVYDANNLWIGCMRNCVDDLLILHRFGLYGRPGSPGMGGCGGVFRTCRSFVKACFGVPLGQVRSGYLECSSSFTVLPSSDLTYGVPGQEEIKLIKEIPSSQDSLQVMEDIESINELMGMEVCDNEDEECFKRRIISEAHLDYIYTQHHKP
ncbi:hypothetical protein Ddye_025312 [Dipteronia dyeriana]|uniref:Phytosulfokine n=1 Tax=Dipteronia dyeriana TaxID=168575 RepID=A0AAD9TXJ3_9ROSI|nr:hypothetical protein Ddye_025312 [Dipteronia dyeriana]